MNLETRREITPQTLSSLFIMRDGESQYSRLLRLESEGLYTPGQIMSVPYANLVNFGTTDLLKIQQIKQQHAKLLEVQNLKVYGTNNAVEIARIIEERRLIKSE